MNKLRDQYFRASNDEKSLCTLTSTLGMIHQYDHVNFQHCKYFYCWSYDNETKKLSKY